MNEHYKIGDKFLFAEPGFEYLIPKYFEFFASKKELDDEAKHNHVLPHWQPLIKEELAKIGKLPWLCYDVYIRIRKS